MGRPPLGGDLDPTDPTDERTVERTVASGCRLDRWQALTQEQRRGFAPLCPDLVVELAG